MRPVNNARRNFLRKVSLVSFLPVVADRANAQILQAIQQAFTEAQRAADNAVNAPAPQTNRFELTSQWCFTAWPVWRKTAPAFHWLPGISHKENTLLVPSGDLNAIKDYGKKRWYDERLLAFGDFKDDLDAFVEADERFRIGKALKDVPHNAKTCAEVFNACGLMSPEVFPAITGMLLAIDVAILLDEVIVDVKELIDGVEEAKKLQKAIVDNPHGFLVRALVATDTGLQETLSFQKHDRGDVVHIWRGDYTQAG